MFLEVFQFILLFRDLDKMNNTPDHSFSGYFDVHRTYLSRLHQSAEELNLNG
jgi:hypothetical protein